MINETKETDGLVIEMKRCFYVLKNEIDVLWPIVPRRASTHEYHTAHTVNEMGEDVIFIFAVCDTVSFLPS